MPANVQSMFSVGEKPWHGLGHVLGTAPSISEAITLAGLNWNVSLRPLTSTLVDGGTPVLVPDKRAVWREDTGAILGVVGDSFVPLQNVDAFGFFEPLVREGLLTLETAGALGIGGRVWVMAKVAAAPAVIVPGASDIVDAYALLCHGHDGSLAVRVGSNPVRVVCQNTLSLALDHGDGLAVIRHTSGMAGALETARSVLARQIDLFRGSSEGWRFLASRTCTDADFAQYALRVVALVRGMSDEAAREVGPGVEIGKRLIKALSPLFADGAGNDAAGVRGTWWAAYNAITQWLTHERGAASGSERDRAERRFAELHLGAGRKLGMRALMLALEGAERSAPSAITGEEPGAPLIHLPEPVEPPPAAPATRDPVLAAAVDAAIGVDTID